LQYNIKNITILYWFSILNIMHITTQGWQVFATGWKTVFNGKTVVAKIVFASQISVLHQLAKNHSQNYFCKCKTS